MHHLDRTGLGHFLDVRTCGEHFFTAGEDDHAHRRVFGGIGDVLGEHATHFHVERVACLGAVNTDQGNAIGGVFEQDDRGGHLKHPSVVGLCSLPRISAATLCCSTARLTRTARTGMGHP